MQNKSLLLTKDWLKNTPYKDFKITVASSDASFRHYYRITLNKKHYIVMESKLEKDQLDKFVTITYLLKKYKINVPAIVYEDIYNQFLVLEDFGSIDLLDRLNNDNFQYYYKMAIEQIIKMQTVDSSNLPLYDFDFLMQEMSLMQTWFLEIYLNKEVSEYETKIIKEQLTLIANKVLEQPQNYFVHRDFHSRNIMLTPQNNLGIIDYQDGMSGSITYDLVSLLKDCYISFDEEEINDLALYFKGKTIPNIKDNVFIEWFDYAGMQRHIKVLGVFSRLYKRDNKDKYLKDIPLTFKYLILALKKYSNLKPLLEILTREFDFNPE